MGLQGQRWTTLDDLRRDYRTKIVEEEPGLSSFSIEPKFGIGQRAFLIRGEQGNILWDCISLFDAAAVEYIRKAGGLAAIAISHPHYYTCLVEWSRTFGDIPVYLHRDDRKWVMWPDNCIRSWDGETSDLLQGVKLIRCGGHFQGASVLHWTAGCEGQGALLTADTIQVAPDRKWVSFMYSYPNYIPVNVRTVEQIVAAVAPFGFVRVYGAFSGMTIGSDGKCVVERSAERYLKAISQ